MEKGILNKKDIIKNSLTSIYDSLIYLLVFEIIYKGLILIIFKPILELIVSLFNKDGIYNFLVNEDITKIFLKSLGYFMSFGLVILSVMIVYFEISVLVLILSKVKRKERIELLEIFKRAREKLKDLFQIKNIGLFPYLAILIPIFNLGISSWLYPLQSIPHILIKAIDKYLGSKLFFILLVVGFIYLFTKLFIVLPIMILSNKSFKEASKLSFKAVKRQGFKIVCLVTLLVLTWLVLAYPPFMILENLQFKLPRMLRSLPNIVITIFTLFITPLMWSVSLESYKYYLETGNLSLQEVYKKTEPIDTSKNPGSILEKILEFIDRQIFKIKDYKKTLIFLSLAAIVGFNVYSDMSVRPLYEKQLLIGHRGGDYGVENTIDAVLYAGTKGADYAEIDILLTDDNIPVVIHDNSLKRLADTKKKISDLTVGEVKEVTIEDGADKDDIPLLEELAKAVKGKTQLIVEFKTHDKERESVVDKSIEILEKEGILEDTIFQTAEDDILEEFNEKYEDLTMGYIFKGEIGLFPTKRLADLSADFISVKQAVVNKKMIKELHKAGKGVFTWTTNSDYKAEKMLKLGVDGIITDHSVEMTQLRDKYKDYNKK